jgi:undecaprenyl-diphosphatase
MTLLADVTDAGPLGGVAAVVVVGLLVTGRRRPAAAVALSVLVVWAVNPLLKEIVERPRPSVRPLPGGLSQYSFPSGHAANTLALVAAVVLVAPVRWRRLAVCTGAAALGVVAVGQLGLAVHYPTDILAGWLWAGSWVAAVRCVLAPQHRAPSTGRRDAARG